MTEGNATRGRNEWRKRRRQMAQMKIALPLRRMSKALTMELIVKFEDAKYL